MLLTRRNIILGGAAVCLASGGGVAATWFNVFGDASEQGALSVDQAYQRAVAGDIYLIDIRRPDEWDRTGIAQPAIALDMRRDDFETVLQYIFDQTGVRPVALICARGVRSDRMTARLQSAGFTDVLDVPEGMLGSGAGSGYLKRDLPLRVPTQVERSGRIGQG